MQSNVELDAAGSLRSGKLGAAFGSLRRGTVNNGNAPLATLFSIRQLLDLDARETAELADAVQKRLENWEAEEGGGWLRRFDSKKTFGERAADAVAERGGSWGFVIGLASFLVAWTLLNTFLPEEKRWDPFPFILLNLFLSMIAAFQAPLIMMSQNRQAAQDRVQTEFVAEASLRAELSSRLIDGKLDHLIHGGWKRLMEMQELQAMLITERGGKWKPGKKSRKAAKLESSEAFNLPRTIRVTLYGPLSHSADQHALQLLRAAAGDAPAPAFLFSHWHRSGDNFSCAATDITPVFTSSVLTSISYTLAPTDLHASLDDLLAGQSSLRLRNDFDIPEQTMHSRILRVSAVFRDGSKLAFDGSKAPVRYVPSFATDRASKVSEIWKRDVASVAVSYGVDGSHVGVGSLVVEEGMVLSVLRISFIKSSADEEQPTLYAAQLGSDDPFPLLALALHGEFGEWTELATGSGTVEVEVGWQAGRWLLFLSGGGKVEIEGDSEFVEKGMDGDEDEVEVDI